MSLSTVDSFKYPGRPEIIVEDGRLKRAPAGGWEEKRARRGRKIGPLQS